LADVERELSGDGAFPLDANTIIRYENTNRLELQYKVEKVPIINARDKFGVYDTKREFLKNYISQIPQYIGELQTEESLDRIKKSFSVRQGNIEQTDTDLHTQFDNNFCEQKNTYPQAGIIFCPHKDNTGISVFRNETSLHKNIPSIGTFIGSSNNDDEQDRKSFENLDKFKNNESPLMVATKAFGMGIDKPNVRFTINMNYSSSLESFVQEAGRAGRDRKMALSVILYADNFDADLDTVMYFYNNNFKGKDVEKQTMHWLLSKSPTPVFYEDNSEYKDTETVNHFLSLLLSMPEGTVIVAFISYVFRDLQNNLVKQIEIYKEQRVTKSIAINVTTGIRKVQLQNGEVISVTKEDIITIDKAGIAKAIYRMCSIGLISDFTEDYANKRYRIVAVRKADGEYYQGIKRFLMRYYSADRAEEERQKVPHYKGENEIHKCLGYLTEFIYEKIAVKRKRAIDDMRTFCIQGIDKNKDWKKINEELKDFIYYYFNSKYAKDDYVADKGGPFSLTKDTDEGKKSSPDIVFKYMRVVDDLVDIDGTPKDNVKHLQGAVRLIRRSLTDTNPALDLLNAFCLFYLGTNNNETLEEELRNSYQEGLNRFSDLTSNYEYFWNFFDDFNKNIPEKAGEFPADKFNDIKEKVTIAIHAKIIRSLTNKYTEK
jgi:ATP-dependent DNA helicase RecQ